MTYMGKPYYPAWLDNLADDVTGEGAAWDGAIQGAAAVHEAVVAAREIYEFQDFHYAGPCGENSFLEDYTSSVRGVPLYVIVLVTFNAAGQAQRLVVNHRPRNSLLLLSRVMLEWFAGTPLLSTGKAHRNGGSTHAPMGDMTREELAAVTDQELLAYEREHHGHPDMTLVKAKGMQRVALRFWHVGAARTKADREAQEAPRRLHEKLFPSDSAVLKSKRGTAAGP